MKINITEHFGKGEVNPFRVVNRSGVGGYVKVTRAGTTTRNGIDLNEPEMDETASVFIASGTIMPDEPTFTATAAEFRWLSRFFDSCATRMDEGLSVPTYTPPEPILLVSDPEVGDTFFTGDLDQARVLVEKDRRIDVRAHVGSYTVHLIDDPDNDDSVAEWGSAASEENAMRFAFGAYFGPADDEYDEHRLLRALARGSWFESSDDALLAASEAAPTAGEHDHPGVIIGCRCADKRREPTPAEREHMAEFLTSLVPATPPADDASETECENGCGEVEPYGWVSAAGCPVHEAPINGCAASTVGGTDRGTPRGSVFTESLEDLGVKPDPWAAPLVWCDNTAHLDDDGNDYAHPQRETCVNPETP